MSHYLFTLRNRYFCIFLRKSLLRHTGPYGPTGPHPLLSLIMNLSLPIGGKKLMDIRAHGVTLYLHWKIGILLISQKKSSQTYGPTGPRAHGPTGPHPSLILVMLHSLVFGGKKLLDIRAHGLTICLHWEIGIFAYFSEKVFLDIRAHTGPRAHVLYSS